MAVMRKATPIIRPFKRIHYNEEDHRKTYKDLNRLWPPIKLSTFSPLSIGTRAFLVSQRPVIKVCALEMVIS